MTMMTRLTRATATIAALAVAATVALPVVAQAGARTTLVSRSSTGVKGSGLSSEPSISITGRYVAFSSDADNLVPGDTNSHSDCFVRDLGSGTTERVSVSSTGQQANAMCWGPAISQDGRWVAFNSPATNLGKSTNGAMQLYLHDRQTHTTRLVSERASGGQGGNGGSSDPGISQNGRYVVYEFRGERPHRR